MVLAIEVKKHLLLEQNKKEIKEDINIVKLSISNYHKSWRHSED